MRDWKPNGFQSLSFYLSPPENASRTSFFTIFTPMGTALKVQSLKSSKAPTNYFTPNILRKSWSRLVVSVVHLDALAFPVAAT